MKKEVLLAIVVGGLFGVLVAFGVWRANTALTTSTEEPVGHNQETSEQVDQTREFALVSPTNNQVLTEAGTSIEGIATAGSYVLAVSDENSALGVSQQDGTFMLEFELKSGTNDITVYSFEPDGTQASEELFVIFSSAFSSGTSVSERLEASANPPLALTGVVTDITDTTIELRSDDGTLEQVSINGETSYVNVQDAPEEVEFSDVAIGDFVIAMGFLNGSEVLDATRVLVDTPTGEETDKAVIRGTVTAFSSTKFLVKTKDEGEVSIDATGGRAKGFLAAKDGKITAAQIGTIKEGDILIVIGNMEDELLAETIYILPAPKAEEPSI